MGFIINLLKSKLSCDVLLHKKKNLIKMVQFCLLAKINQRQLLPDGVWFGISPGQNGGRDVENDQVRVGEHHHHHQQPQQQTPIMTAITTTTMALPPLPPPIPPPL